LYCTPFFHKTNSPQLGDHARPTRSCFVS
jgi:hypothetical protein